MIANEDYQVEISYTNESQITKIGSFLRRTGLDELPQLYNVLLGHMSIVGPRPHSLEDDVYFCKHVESFMRRYRVKPGITGWAQVNGLRGLTRSVDEIKKKAKYDSDYIDNWSLFLDIKIIMLTLVELISTINSLYTKNNRGGEGVGSGP